MAVSRTWAQGSFLCVPWNSTQSLPPDFHESSAFCEASLGSLMSSPDLGEEPLLSTDQGDSVLPVKPRSQRAPDCPGPDCNPPRPRDISAPSKINEEPAGQGT